MSNPLVFSIKIYRKFISRLLVVLFGQGCRFYPTCSHYAKEAIESHGAVKGTILSLRRFLRCHPFSSRPFIDPVPVKS